MNCILLILLIVVVSILLFYVSQNALSSVVLGGAVLASQNSLPDTKNQLFIADNASIICDGHNLIHQLIGKANILEFEQGLKRLSAILSMAFPTQDLHLVLKNPDHKTEKLYNKIKRKKKCNSIPYFDELCSISKEFPSITYHLAYQPKGKKQKLKNQPHHMKGRDDFLAILLQNRKSAYIISKDRFRDFKDFGSIKSFVHYSTKAGKCLPKEHIKPINSFHKLKQPNRSNHFLFHLESQKSLNRKNITTGTIYYSGKTQYGHIYFGI